MAAVETMDFTTIPRMQIRIEFFADQVPFVLLEQLFLPFLATHAVWLSSFLINLYRLQHSINNVVFLF